MQGYTQIDHDLALLVLRLGGRQLLHALQQRMGISSHATIKLQDRASFLVSHKGFNPQHADSNSASMLRPQRGPRVMMMDELAVEAAARYDPSSNQLAGVCWQHGSNCNLTVDTPERIQELRDSIQGEGAGMHLAAEATVVAVGMLSDVDA
jgi:hypothetical protein